MTPTPFPPGFLPVMSANLLALFSGKIPAASGRTNERKTCNSVSQKESDLFVCICNNVRHIIIIIFIILIILLFKIAVKRGNLKSKEEFEHRCESTGRVRKCFVVLV